MVEFDLAISQKIFSLANSRLDVQIVQDFNRQYSSDQNKKRLLNDWWRQQKRKMKRRMTGKMLIKRMMTMEQGLVQILPLNQDKMQTE